jgi:nicotinic acid mononucleotide adenylyltransferase
LSYNDLDALFRLRDLLAAIDPEGHPITHALRHPRGEIPERIAVLAGSFNPLTTAHVALARAALRSVQLPVVYLLLSKVTVDKERLSGALLEDRLLVLHRYAAARRRLGIVVVNRGLYVEQAIALRRTFPAIKALYFIVGFDKILQIFDPRYYADRDAALDELFRCAEFLVAPRADFAPPALMAQPQHGPLEQLLARPDNRRFRPYVRPLIVPPGFAGLSSTRVRARLAAGHSIERYVPKEVVTFVAQTGAYQPPLHFEGGESVERYALRSPLIELLSGERSWSTRLDLSRLLQIVWSDTAAGAELRDLLRRRPTAAVDHIRRAALSP